MPSVHAEEDTTKVAKPFLHLKFILNYYDYCMILKLFRWRWNRTSVLWILTGWRGNSNCKRSEMVAYGQGMIRHEGPEHLMR